MPGHEGQQERVADRRTSTSYSKHGTQRTHLVYELGHMYRPIHSAAKSILYSSSRKPYARYYLESETKSMDVCEIQLARNDDPLTVMFHMQQCGLRAKAEILCPNYSRVCHGAIH